MFSLSDLYYLLTQWPVVDNRLLLLLCWSLFLPQLSWVRISLVKSFFPLHESSTSVLSWLICIPCRCFVSPAESSHFHGIPLVPQQFLSRSWPTHNPLSPRVSVSPVSFPYGMHYTPADLRSLWLLFLYGNISPQRFAFTLISYALWGLLGTKLCFYMLLFKPILLSRHEDFNLLLLCWKVYFSPVESSAHFLSEIAFPCTSRVLQFYPDLFVSPADVLFPQLSLSTLCGIPRIPQ
jgi:hypothetical protein